MLDDLDLGGITDAAALSVVARLLNVVEKLGANKESGHGQEAGGLRDENSRLKGEQPRPRILPGAPRGSTRASASGGGQGVHGGRACRTCPSTGWRSAGWTAARCRRMRP